MGRLYESYVGTKLGGSINVSKGYPLDVKTVVETVADLKNGKLLNSSYEGLVVYVIEDKSLYVCFNKPSNNKLTNVEDGWKKVDVDYSVRIVEAESNLTDGETILFPFQGMMAYVTSESALYVLLTKGVENAKDINNWRKISATSSASLIDKVGINVAPDGGSGFKITENKDVIVEDYANVENYIKADYFYTSKGINSFDKDSTFTHESVRLSKGGDAYIELSANGNNWIAINDTDGTLGLSVSVKDGEFVMGEPIAKESFVCFGVDIQFTDGWIISYGDESRPFIESDYELIDIYRNEHSPEVYAYLKDIDVRVLTEDDLIEIDDKIDNLAHLIMIDLNATPSEPDKPVEPDKPDVGDSDGDSDYGDSDGCGDSDYGDSDICGDSDVPDNPEGGDKPEGGDTNTPNPVPLQQVIVQMNNSITKLEKTLVEPDPIEHSEIDQLFS